MNGALRLALVGCGGIAGLHAACLAELAEKGQAQLVAATDSDPEALARFCARWTIAAAPDLEQLLAMPEVEAVAICTPSGTHAAIGVAAAQAGRHVLTEKPIDIDLAAADRLIAACRAADVRLGVISQHRWDPGARALRDALEAGRLGRLLLGEASIKWYRSQGYYDSAGWRGTWAIDGGGALINQGIHTIDLLLWCMGEVAALQAYTATAAHRIEVEDLATAALRFRNGALGTIVGSTAIYPGLPERLSIHGEHGSIELRAGELATWALRDELGEPGAYGKTPPALQAAADAAQAPAAMARAAHSAQLADFAAAVREARPPAVTGEDGRRALQTILAIYESARLGAEVHLPPST